MTQDKDGQYVSYHDYAMLLDSHNRLRAELAGKEKALAAAKTVIEAKDKAYALIDQRFAAMAAKAATTDSERECNERLTAEIDALTAELAEARRLLDEARKQEPVVECFSEVAHGWRECARPDSCSNAKRNHYAAPVPAQPAVPDAERLLSELKALRDLAVHAGGPVYVLPQNERTTLTWAMDVISTLAAAPVPAQTADDEARLWSYAEDMSTCTLSVNGKHYEYDRVPAQPAASAKEATRGGELSHAVLAHIAAQPAVPESFVEYLKRNYPPNTVIGDPAWHARPIWNAACHALQVMPTTTAPTQPAAPTYAGPCMCARDHCQNRTSMPHPTWKCRKEAQPAVPDDVAKDARLGSLLYVWDYENPEDGQWDNIEEYLHDTTPNVGEVVRLNLALPLVDVVVEMLEVGKCGEPIRWEVRDVKTGAVLSTTEGRSNG